MKMEFLEGGKIQTAHGVKGLLRVEHFCDSPKILSKQKTVYLKKRDGSYEPREVLSASLMGEVVLMGLSGVTTREDAAALRGVTLYLKRDSVPKSEGAMFLSEMIGLPVYHAESGEMLGKLVDVNEISGRRLYTVNVAGVDRMIPDVKDFIKEISEDGMRILPIPGLLSDDEV